MVFCVWARFSFLYVCVCVCVCVSAGCGGGCVGAGAVGGGGKGVVKVRAVECLFISQDESGRDKVDTAVVIITDDTTTGIRQKELPVEEILITLFTDFTSPNIVA